MTKPAFIFDLDGTLGDTLPLCIFSFQEALERVSGVRPTKEEVMYYFGYTEEGITKNLYPRDWTNYYDAYLSVYKEHHHMCPEPFDGIIEILSHIKNNGHKMSMVTGKGYDSAQITLEKFGLKEFFEHVETGSPKGNIKPECIQRILNDWDVEPSQVYYVGDSHTDIIDSKKAGVVPIAVSWATTANHEKLVEHEPHKIFSKIEDFKHWITKSTGVI